MGLIQEICPWYVHGIAFEDLKHEKYRGTGMLGRVRSSWQEAMKRLGVIREKYRTLHSVPLSSSTLLRK